MNRKRAAAAIVGILVMLGLIPGFAQAEIQSGPQGDSSIVEKPTSTARTMTTAAVDPPTITPECPQTIRCVVDPAAFAPNNGVEDYGNYDLANRPNDLKITSIVIHDGEGSCEEIRAAFRNPAHYASTQYVVCRDGTVYQMVRTRDLPWHAGNWYYNMHSIGIEHEGNAATGSTDYTPAMYWASAQLVKYLTTRFGIPRDRGHIIGHDNVPAVKTSQIAGMHYDPGPYWNWQLYMALIGAPVLPTGLGTNFVTIAPQWGLSRQAVVCPTGVEGCSSDASKPTNFIQLTVEPRANSALLTDPVTGQGSALISNNAAKLFYGQTFAVATKRLQRDGVWYQVYVNGVKGWFFSPWSAPTAFPASPDHYITPKPGLSSIPVYGRPSPETSAYPADLLASPPASFWIPTLAPTTPLAYTIPAGQKYTVVDPNPVNDHSYAWSMDSSFPYDHTVWVGTTRYIEIQFGNRVAFVKADDVILK